MRLTTASVLTMSLIAGTGCNETKKPTAPQQVQQEIRKEVMKSKKTTNAMKDFWLICNTEGRGKINHNAINVYENARGAAQLTPIFVEDCNTWLKANGMKTYTHEDAHDPSKAFIMCQAYWRKYNLTTTEERCRAHCAGPDGPWQDCSLEYWRIAQSYM